MPVDHQDNYLGSTPADGHVSSTTARSLGLTLGGNGALALLAFATGPFLARLLGPSGRGELAAIQLWPGIMGALAVLGLHDAVAYYSARDRQGSGGYVTLAMALGLVASLPTTAVGYFVLPSLLASQPADTVLTAQRYLVFLIPPCTLYFMPMSSLRGCGRIPLWNAVRVLPALLWLLLLVYAARSPIASVELLSTFYLATLAVTALVGVGVVAKVTGLRVSWSVRKARSLLTFGLTTTAATAPQLISQNLPRLLVASVLGPRLLGLYVVAVAWSSAATLLLSTMPSVLLPRIAPVQPSSERIRLLGRWIRLATVLAAVTALGLSLLTPFALPLIFGAGFSSAIPSAVMLVAAASLAGLNGVVEEGARAIGEPQLAPQGEIVGLLVTVGSLALFLAPHGIEGAALSSALGQLAASFALVVLLGRLTATDPRTFVCPKWSELHAALCSARRI